MPLDVAARTKAKPKRPQLPRTTPANATHVLIGMIVNMRKSIDTLRYEIADRWADVEDLRIALSNANDEIDELLKRARTWREHRLNIEGETIP